eukprot:3485544-Rhodomonas_salina.1
MEQYCPMDDVVAGASPAYRISRHRGHSFLASLPSRLLALDLPTLLRPAVLRTTHIAPISHFSARGSQAPSVRLKSNPRALFLRNTAAAASKATRAADRLHDALNETQIFIPGSPRGVLLPPSRFPAGLLLPSASSSPHLALFFPISQNQFASLGVPAPNICTKP